MRDDACLIKYKGGSDVGTSVGSRWLSVRGHNGMPICEKVENLRSGGLWETCGNIHEYVSMFCVSHAGVMHSLKCSRVFPVSGGKEIHIDPRNSRDSREPL